MFSRLPRWRDVGPLASGLLMVLYLRWLFPFEFQQFEELQVYAFHLKDCRNAYESTGNVETISDNEERHKYYEGLRSGTRGKLDEQHTVQVVYRGPNIGRLGTKPTEGRTFSGLIQSFLSTSKDLNEIYLPLHETETGRKVYDETLQSVRDNFPQYVREMEGTADGAGVPFHKLFLLHLDDIVSNVVHGPSKSQYCNGCSTVCCNQPGEEILGHTEDALHLVLNHFYFVSAHIISESPQGRWGVKEERFTSLCYAGHLPGFTMSYNHHGLAFSVNIISAKKLVSGKTPRYFLTRAMLGAENLVQVQQILRDKGCGAAEGFSINMTFLRQEGDRLFHNAEVSPATDGTTESGLSILTASPGESFVHCNKYLRLQAPELAGCIMESSNHRHATMNKMPVPLSCKDIINMLGDQSDPEYMVFRETGGRDYVKTVAVGIFDCVARTWSIYADNPKTSEPIVVLPMVLKSESKKLLKI